MNKKKIYSCFDAEGVDIAQAFESLLKHLELELVECSDEYGHVLFYEFDNAKEKVHHDIEKLAAEYAPIDPDNGHESCLEQAAYTAGAEEMLLRSQEQLFRKQDELEKCIQKNKMATEESERQRRIITLLKDALERYSDGSAFEYNRIVRGEVSFDSSKTKDLAIRTLAMVDAIEKLGSE